MASFESRPARLPEHGASILDRGCGAAITCLEAGVPAAPCPIDRPLRAPLLLHFALYALLFFTLARPASAHDPFELTTTARLTASELRFETTSTRGCALALIDPARPSGAAFAPEDLPQLRPRLEAAARELFMLSQRGLPLSPLRVEVELNQELEARWTVIYPPPVAGPLLVRARHLQALGPSYASAITLTQDNPPAVLGSAVFTTDAAELSVEVLAPSTAHAPTRPADTSTNARLGFRRAFSLGVEHILAGFDHLLFLAGLLVACRRARAMIGIVTAFTLAHSVTLGLSALDVVVVPARVVEPLIAASIVLVGVENLARRDAPPLRAALCFAFGLIHGFGFAGALRDLGLGRAGAPIVEPLLGFNLGVEAGQLLVVSVLLPLLLWVRKRPALSRLVLPAASAAVAASGLFWLVDRTLLS